MQNTRNSFGMNQQGIYGQNHFGQQDPFPYTHQQQPQQLNPCFSNYQSSISGNPCLCTPGMVQPQNVTACGNYNLQTQNILEQIRSCIGNPSPIIILPNGQPIAQNPSPQLNMAYQNTGYNPGQAQNPIFATPCYPIPAVPMNFYDGSFGNQLDRQCNCNCRKAGTKSSTTEDNDSHRCTPGIDDTICTKINCPASINLQALASQLLSLHGVIPCAATRLLLKKIPGSNVTTSVDDTMERAQKSIALLNKEQLINEARNAQQVNGVINLHMMANNPPRNIIPILTMLQLKINSLKSMVENLVNKSISECQSVGADGNTNLESVILSLKSDAEIRELLASLRQKECDERVNVNYAPYHSQKIIAESRLANIQNKIHQIESEMERRRGIAMPWGGYNTAGQFNQTGGSYGVNVHSARSNNQLFNPNQGYESPSPFMVQVKNPKRLNLKPNVGAPQTYSNCSSEEQNGCYSPEAFAVSKLEKDGNGESSCVREENTESSKDDGGKRMLKIHIDKSGELSVKKQSLEGLDVAGGIVQLSPDVVIVIDKETEAVEGENKKDVRDKRKEKNESKKTRNKSPESVRSDSTFYSETSLSSAEESEPEKNKRGKSGLRNILKSKKKTPSSKNESPAESLNKNIHESEQKDDSVGHLSTKKDKHVSVAMISEVSYDPFEKNQDTKNIESESDCKAISEDRKILCDFNMDNRERKLIRNDRSASELSVLTEPGKNRVTDKENRGFRVVENLEIEEKNEIKIISNDDKDKNVKEQCSIFMKENKTFNNNSRDSINSIDKDYRRRKSFR